MNKHDLNITLLEFKSYVLEELKYYEPEDRYSVWEEMATVLSKIEDEIEEEN